MKRDIIFPKVKNVWVAIAREKNILEQYEWAAYLVNNNTFRIKNVMVSSSGYGEKDNEEQNTSILRHFFEEIEAKSFAQIEMIDPSVFHLNNEYWVSYWYEKEVYDKRFIFVPDSIVESNIMQIPILEKEGILHE